MLKWCTLAAVVLAPLFSSVIASATTYNHWGYNYLSYYNPAGADECSSPPWNTSYGVACSGFRYYDYTQVQKLGGSQTSGTFRVGFIFSCCPGIFGVVNGPGFDTYTHAWNKPEWAAYASHYNRVACLYETGGSSNSYVQCRGLVF
jgi:hypothetical protein